MRWKYAAIFLPFWAALAQTPCDSSLKPIQARGVTMFSPEQEGFLGEAVAELMQRGLPVYRQPGLTDPLDRIADRLQPYLPGSAYRFQFSLIELPQANAFAIPGGRIFVSRKLVAFVRNEDELAGVLAHEMGHVVARQASTDVTRLFNDVLKVTSVGDRQDVFRKFNLLMEAPARRTTPSREEDDQVVADRALAAAWRAGYDPRGLPEFLDRLTGNKGATGDFLTDLFGVTRPESKRLREMLKEVEAIPPACRDKRNKTGDEEFRAWQKKVAELSPEDLTSNHPLSNPSRKAPVSLRPRLQPAIANIRFSPDGQWLIAQDETGIDVVKREPLGFLFRIPASGAHAALFGADSRHVMFVATSLRVEVWNLETRSREFRWEPNDNFGCRSLTPSPDGRVVACVSSVPDNRGASLRLLDMTNNTELAQHDLAGGNRFQTLFSPDGVSFLLCYRDVPFPWAFSVQRRAEIPLGGPLKSVLAVGASFLGSNELVVARTDPKSSGVFSWPDGKQTQKVVIPDAPFSAVTKGSVVLLRGFQGFAIAELGLQEGQIFQVSRNPAMDRYDDVEAAERKTGEIALYAGRKTEPIATLQLPPADLGRTRSVAHSPDLEWLAVSIENRGAIWNLKTGQSLFTVPFAAGYISAEGVWMGTFEETEPGASGQGDKKYFSRETVDLRKATVVNRVRGPEAQTGRTIVFSGKYQVMVHFAAKPEAKNSLEVTDTAAGKKLWSLELEQAPRFTVGNAMVLQYRAKGKAADQLLQEFPGLKESLDQARSHETATVLEVRDLETGKPLGGVVLDGGVGLFIRSIQLAGRTLFLEENNNRTLAYSLDTGERSGQQFGHVLAVDPVRSLVAVENQAGEIAVFDRGMQPLGSFSYAGAILYAGFDGQGKRLLVVTNEEEVFIDDLPL